VQACADLIASHPLECKRYGDLVGHLSAAWKELVRGSSVITGVVEDADCDKLSILGFGFSVFVTDAFLHHCKIPSVRWIGSELLRWHTAGKSPILGTETIRDANSREGLNSATWATALVPRNENERAPLQMELMNGFMQEHRGYRLKEVVSQPIELCMMEVVLNSGGFLWDPGQRRYTQVHNHSRNVEALLQRPFLLGADRETSKQHLNWSTTLFQYREPCIFLRPSEQRLLLAALNEGKDEELSDQLGVSLSFVKKTWSSIYKRIGEALPELSLCMFEGPSRQRGKEKKQRVLSYLRDHPEELRPVAIPAKQV